MQTWHNYTSSLALHALTTTHTARTDDGIHRTDTYYNQDQLQETAGGQCKGTPGNLKVKGGDSLDACMHGCRLPALVGRMMKNDEEWVLMTSMASHKRRSFNATAIKISGPRCHIVQRVISSLGGHTW